MACMTKIVMATVLAKYKYGFGYVGSLVDIGGRMGGMIADIVKTHSHVKGIDFDLPHIVSTTPLCQGVSHVGGDAIPSVDAIFMKVYI